MKNLNNKLVCDELKKQLHPVGYEMSDDEADKCVSLIVNAVAVWMSDNEGDLDVSDKARLVAEYRPDWELIGFDFDKDMGIIDRLDWTFVFACELASANA